MWIKRLVSNTIFKCGHLFQPVCGIKKKEMLDDKLSEKCGKVMSKSMKGHLKVSMRFSKALAETINVLVYGKFPEILTTDHTSMFNKTHGY